MHYFDTHLIHFFMEFPKVKTLYDRRHKATATKRGSVEIEIYYNKQRKWISTKVSVLPAQWSDDYGVINHPNSFMLNQQIATARNLINQYITSVVQSGDAFSLDGLTAYLNAKHSKGDFVTYMEERIRARNDIAKTTKACHLKALKLVREFGKFRSFEDVTRRNILAFDEFLHSFKYKQATIHYHHKVLRIYINDAIARGFMSDYPYRGIKIERGKSEVRKYLTLDEIKLIQNCHQLPHILEEVRDLFLFQSYTGLAYSDVYNFKSESVTERDGRHILAASRKKTEENYYVVLTDKAVAILKKYNGKLPHIFNDKYNNLLKELAEEVGIDKRITSHMARHTFAVTSLNAGIPIEVVSKMLGHTNIQTTQIYAKVINKTIDSAFDKIAEVYG